MARAICADRYQKLAGDESLAFCGLDDRCVEDGRCDGCDYKELLCPCGEKLAYFSGLDRIPSYLYCPSCNDKAYNDDGSVLALLE